MATAVDNVLLSFAHCACPGLSAPFCHCSHDVAVNFLFPSLLLLLGYSAITASTIPIDHWQMDTVLSTDPGARRLAIVTLKIQVHHTRRGCEWKGNLGSFSVIFGHSPQGKR